MSGWWQSKEIKVYSSKIFEQSRSSSDERQGHNTNLCVGLLVAYVLKQEQAHH
jgi:hypothetical protein